MSTKKAEAQATEQTQAVVAPLTFARKKAVIVPVLKLVIDQPVYVKATAPMFVGKEIKGEGDKAKMEPAIILPVINLQTGEEMQMIANKVMQANLDEVYPNAGYVGKGFEVTKHEKRDGKRYNDFSLFEIEI